jgi:hypothetical protein
MQNLCKSFYTRNKDPLRFPLIGYFDISTTFHPFKIMIIQDGQLQYMRDVMILNLQSLTFLFYKVIHHFHLLILCISRFDLIKKSILCVWGLFKTRQTTYKKLMLEGYNESRLKSTFCKLYGRYNDLVCDYSLSLVHILIDLFHSVS